jgi:hypothetical protein
VPDLPSCAIPCPPSPLLQVKDGLISETINADGTTYIAISEGFFVITDKYHQSPMARYLVRADGQVDRTKSKVPHYSVPFTLQLYDLDHAPPPRAPSFTTVCSLSPYSSTLCAYLVGVLYVKRSTII